MQRRSESAGGREPLTQSNGSAEVGSSTSKHGSLFKAEPRRAYGWMNHPTFVWCFAAFLVANTAAGRADQLGLPLPLGLDRVLFGVAAVLFLLDRRFRLRDLRLGWVHLAATAMVSVAALSALSHGVITTSYGFFALLDRLAIPFLVFAVAPIAFSRSEDRLLLMRTLALLGIYLGVMAFLEVIGPQSLVWPRYIMDPSVGAQFGRARGPFAESEANGLTLAATFWCAVQLTRVSTGWFWRQVAMLSLLLSSLGVLLALTRSVWVGMAVGFVVLTILDRRLRRWLIVGAVALSVAIPIALLSF